MRFFAALFLFLVLFVGGGLLVLAYVPLNPPVQNVERVLTDAQNRT